MRDFAKFVWYIRERSSSCPMTTLFAVQSVPRVSTRMGHVQTPRVTGVYGHIKKGVTLTHVAYLPFFPSSSMGAAGPSSRRAGIESTYEQDLRGLLDRLSLEEKDEFQASMTRRISAGGRLSDHEIALNDLIQQARELAALEQDRMLAERIAIEEDSDVDVDHWQPPTVETEAPHVDPEPTGKR